MKQFHKIFMLSLTLFVTSSFYSYGSNLIQQVIFASGGHFGATGNKVTFYAFNPSLLTVKAFDSVPGNFTSAAVVDNGIIFITADSVLYRYNADTYKKLDSIVLTGVNHLMINGNYLIVSRWYPATSNYIQIFDKNTLKLSYNDTRVLQACNSIICLRDTAYIAESSSDSGRIAVMDLSGSTPKFVKEINMDTSAMNIQDLATDGQFIYAYSYGYTPSYTVAPTRASAYEIATWKHKFLANNPATINVVSGMVSGGKFNVLGTVGTEYDAIPEFGFNAGNTTQTPFNIADKAYTNAVYDSLNNTSYLVTNDFSTKAHVYIVKNSSKNVYLDSFLVGVSTQAVAIDYRLTSGIESAQISTIDFSVYPNPVNSILHVSLPAGEKYKVTVLNMTGKEMMNTNTTDMNTSMNISALPNGVYLMRVQNNINTGVQRFIKQ